MSKFKYIVLISFLLLFAVNSGLRAENSLGIALGRLIEEDDLSKTAVVSVSVRELEGGKLIYERNGDLLLHPASTLKAFTTPLAFKYLGADNEITTGLYKSENAFYLKLSGDPLLTSDELFNMFKRVKAQGIGCMKLPLFIDDTAIDEIPWGIGWMWDDQNSPYMPKISAYNLDKNLIKVKVLPSLTNCRPKVEIPSGFPLEIINTAITTDTNDLTVERRPWLEEDTIYVEGTVSASVEKIIPAGSPEKYFIYNLRQALKANNISFQGEIQKGKISSDAYLIEEISHPVIEEVTHTNHKSDNLAAETLLKLVAGKYSGTTGTTKNGLKAFNEFYNNLGVDVSEIVVVDGSGVSHNDLLQTSWMSLALEKLYKADAFNIYRNSLASPNVDSTLQYRLDSLAGKLWAKTGTLSGISGITGYLETDSGQIYCFAILIQNYKGNSFFAKNLEDKILNLLNKSR